MKDCKKCIHYEACRDWYGSENGMPNYSEDIECKNYLTTDSETDVFRAMLEKMKEANAGIMKVSFNEISIIVCVEPEGVEKMMEAYDKWVEEY